jgi:YidC/Oxa1 family membrane protein insertase
LDIKGQHFKKVLSNYTSITFVQSDATKKIVKRFIFDNSNYSIKLEINVQNNSNVSLDNSLKLHLGRLDFHPNNPGGQYQDVAVGTSERTLHVSGKKSASFAQAKFLALRERYFSLIAQPEKSNCDAVIAAAPNQPTEVAMLLPEETIAPGGQIGHFVQIYLGPLNNKYINKVNPDWTFIVHYGVFDIVAQVILQLLDLLFRLTHNWGWAIVLLSLIVYFVLFPLSLKHCVRLIKIILKSSTWRL